MTEISVGKSIFVMVLLGVLPCNEVSCLTQNDLTYIASNLNIHYEVLNNLESEDTYKSRLNLTNGGKKEINYGPWAIYFNFIRLVEPKHLKKNPSAGYIIPNIGMKFVHITGSLFKLEPLKGFQTLSAGESLSFDFGAQFYSVAKTDVMPNWYIAAEGFEAMNVKNTSGEDLNFVGRFDMKQKWKRTKDDRYNPFTPAKRFEQINVENKRPSPGSIIPSPVEIKVVNEQYVNVSNWTIVTAAEYEKEAMYLGQKLNLSVNNASEIGTKILRLVQQNVDVKIDGQKSNSMERYAVDVKDNVITISAPESRGMFYGIQSLLFVTNIERKQVLTVSLKDAPRFEYRGLMLDISRNFHGKSSILKILNVMARYKLNKLHLHLTDDEGWRLEIPGLQELTTFGSLRCHDTGMCLAPQLGSGAKPDTSGSGSLSVDDYRDILRHARILHIEIIPEFDMPGHSHAAIKAMEYRFQKYNASNNETVRKDASKFLLAEPDDPSKYFSVQMFRDNAINPCLNSTYNFIEHVLSALVDLHKDISPLKLFHMGGDEVAHGAWINSTACKNFIVQNKDIDSLKKYFATRVSEIVLKYNISFAAWEDGLIEENVLFNKAELSRSSVYSYAWDNVWEWGAFDRAYRFANAGYKTVLGHATHVYFDMPYEPDPEERGYYWATRYTNTKKTFGYMPDSVYDNAKEDRFGKPLSKEKLCKERNSCPPLVKKSNIVGIQGHLWSETVRDEEQIFFMCFPRVLALAERAWHKAEFEKDEKSRKQKLEMEWKVFANLLGFQELRKLDEMGVSYRVPLPGAKIESGILVASSAFPGLKIEYSTSGEWKEYTSPMEKLSGNIKLRTLSADGKRSSREINVDVPLSQGSRNINPVGVFAHLVMFFVMLFYNYF